MSDVRPQFQRIFNRPADVVAQAPGRVNLIGEHVDYCDGFVLPLAINYATRVAISIRDDATIRIANLHRKGEIHESSLEELSPLGEQAWVKYVHGVIWVMAQNEKLSGMDILVEGDVPIGAGLSSSAALECSTALAINELFSLRKQPSELALLAQRAENTFVGMPCGIMDQMASMLATSSHALLIDCRNLATEQIPLPLHENDMELLIIDTKTKHKLVDGEYAARRKSCESAAQTLGVSSLRELSLEQLLSHRQRLDSVTFSRAHHVVTEIARTIAAAQALKGADFSALGTLMNASHESLRVDFEVSTKELDLAVTTAIKHGAIGSRMTGGGFGGSAIALVKREDRIAITAAIENSFQESGFAAPAIFPALASQGAHTI